MSDWLIGHYAVLINRLPCYLGSLRIWYNRQGSDFAEEGGEGKEVVSKGGFRGEVRGGHWYDTKGLQNALTSGLFAILFFKINWRCRLEFFLYLLVSNFCM